MTMIRLLLLAILIVLAMMLLGLLGPRHLWPTSASALTTWQLALELSLPDFWAPLLMMTALLITLTVLLLMMTMLVLMMTMPTCPRRALFHRLAVT